jgi:hypothetical protein
MASRKVRALATLPALSLFGLSACGGPADPTEPVAIGAAVACPKKPAGDLPPVPTFADPSNPFVPATDANGAPIVGPTFLPQLFSTDPGRAAITGAPHDFEAFDVPALRGIANPLSPRQQRREGRPGRVPGDSVTGAG